MLFKSTRPDEKLHPTYVRTRDDPRYAPGRLLMEEAFVRFNDRDGTFVEQFQTTGLDQRTFELYVSELLRAEGFIETGQAPQPDFIVSKSGVTIAIECTTANPKDDGKGPRMRPYRHLEDKATSLSEISEVARNDIPARIGAALRKKLQHRVKVGTERIPYWELPQCESMPFVVAVQSFHSDGSLGYSDAGIAEYLYGIRHSPEWDNHGNLVVKSDPIDGHKDRRRGALISSGLFNQAGSEHLSGVLWSNAGTIPKFNRMALAGEHATDAVVGLRYGNCYDPDPNAISGLPFAYIIGDPEAPRETWGLEAIFFHNPNTSRPIAEGLFDQVSEASYVDSVYSVKHNNPFHPFMSATQFFVGQHRWIEANMIGEMMWEALSQAYLISSSKDNNPLWPRD